MDTGPQRWPGHIVWCFGGFLFPLAIWAVGFAFEEGHPPAAAAVARAWVSPETLNAVVVGLLLVHMVAALAAVLYFERLSVVLVSVVQVAASLPVTFLASMAVRGMWL